MSIRLKWKNPNTGASVVRIYRSATPIDTAALPAPILEVSDGSTQYLDEFPKYGESFYYVFSVTVGGRTIFSPNKLYSCIIDLGPGPQELILGDMKMGYFGTVSPFELGFSASIFPNATFTSLHKLARNGKIIYSPLVSVSAIARDWVNAKVFTSGINAHNDPYAGTAGMIREFNGRLYAMRAAKLWDEGNTDTNLANYQIGYGPGVAGVAAPMGKSEMIDIIRLARAANPSIPARFSFNSDNYDAISSGPFTSSDFSSATTSASFHYTSSNPVLALVTNGRGLTSSSYLYPVIEYKGNA